MRVGILGSGLMGGKLGTIFARAGHEVVFSYSRSERKLSALAREAGKKARAGTPAEAAQGADTLLLAVHWSRIDDVLSQAGDLSGKIIVSCSRAARRRDPVSCSAATTRAEKKWPVRSSTTWASSLWMPGLCESPGTRSRSRSSSHTSLTRGKTARRWRTGSNGSARTGDGVTFAALNPTMPA